MKKRTMLITAAAILVGGFLISNILSNQKKPMRRRQAPSTQKPLATQTVKNSDIETAFELAGPLVALDKVEMYAEVSGVLQATPKRFREGQRYSAGEVMVRIDDSVYKNSVLSQKSSLLNQITLLLPDLKIDFPESAGAWEAYLKTFQMDKPLAPLPPVASEQEKYYIASRNIYTQYYSVKGMEATWAKYELKAPYDGVVTLSSINPGTLVRSGQKMGEFISTAVYEMEAFAGLDDIKHLKTGQPVTLTCPDLEGTFQGRIKRINSILDPSSQTIKVYVTTRDQRLTEGLYMNAKVMTPPIEKAARLPRTALVGTNQVWIVTDSTLSTHPVDVALNQPEHLIVQGLENGMKVVTNPPSEAYEGMVVTLPNTDPQRQEPQQRPQSGRNR